ncbi:hypothetical protein Tco_1213816 [Tanacetum coccineum]
MTGLVSEKYVENAHNESSLSITSNDINVELSKEFFVELRKNTYHGTLNEEVVDHIAKVLEMVDLIYITGVDSHQLRINFFPFSLADNAKEWWTNEREVKITTWEELVKKFFCRFYHESYDEEDEMLDEGENWVIDPLEFLSNMNTVLYRVEDIVTYLVKYVKLWDEWEVYRYGNANLVIKEYLVKVYKRPAFWSLNEDILKINDSDYQYAGILDQAHKYMRLGGSFEGLEGVWPGVELAWGKIRWSCIKDGTLTVGKATMLDPMLLSD